MNPLPEHIRRALSDGRVIPAHPLALTANRTLDERRQRALARYYLASGAGGLAVGVHTTQFAIRDPAVGLFRPVSGASRRSHGRTGRSQLRSHRGRHWPNRPSSCGGGVGHGPRLSRRPAQPSRPARRR